MAYFSHSLKLEYRPSRAGNPVPTAAPPAAAAIVPGSRPLAITVGIPAAVAISAATTLERIPPEPRGDAVCPMSRGSRALKSVTSVTSCAEGSRCGSAVNTPPASVSRRSRSAPSRIATWAARKSLLPNEISSVVVVSFSLITGTTRHSSSLRSVWRALR